MSRYPAKLALFVLVAASLAHGVASCTAGQSIGGNSTSSSFNTTGSSLLVAPTVGYINQNVITDGAANYWNYLSTYGGTGVGPHTTLGWVDNPVNLSASETLTNLTVVNTSPIAPVSAMLFCSGMNPYPPVAQNGITNAGASTFTPGAVTALAGQLIVIACGTNGSTVAVTSIANSFITDFAINGGTNEGIVVFHLVAPSTASYNPSITMTANTDWSCGVGVFSAVGDGTLPPALFGPSVTLQVGGTQVPAYGAFADSCTPAAVTGGAKLSWPMEIAFMPNGDIVWDDYLGNAIRYYNRQATSVTAFGKTIGAGCTALIGGQANGAASGFNYSTTPILGTSAQIARPAEIAIDSSNNVYVADQQNHRIFELRYADGMLFTVVGSGVSTNGNCTNGASSGDGGPPTSATLNCPQGVWWGSNNGNPYLLIADSDSHRIRAVNLSGSTQTIFGTSIAANTINTIVGTGTAGCSTSGTATSALISDPVNVTVDSGNLYYADAVQASCPYFMKVSSGGTLSVFAGNGTQGYLYGACTASEFYQPQDIRFDSNHVAYLTDQQGGTISMAKNGVCSNLAGNYAFSGNRGGMGPVNYPARAISLEGYLNNSVAGPLAADPDNQGNLWISDSGSSRILSINLPCYASCMQ